MQRRAALIGLAGASAWAVAAGSAWAKPAYPNRAIRLVCPYAAGGGPDILCRELAPLLGEALGGQSVYVENKVGAGGVLAAQYLVGQPADGYTLMQATNAHLIQKLLQPQLKFALSDFKPISLVSSACFVLMVSADSPWRSVADVVAAAKAAPGKLNFGSGGIGTPAHVAGEMLASFRQLKVVHVPLKGSVEIPLSLMRGETQFAFPNLGTAMSVGKTGKLRMLAVTGPKRVATLPDVPTLAEALGTPQAVLESWSGIWVHANTPADIVQRLHAVTQQAAMHPRMREYAQASGSESVSSASPQAFAQFVQADNAKMAKVLAMSQVNNG